VDDGDGEHQKTVYAHFGLAIYVSQVLEHGLANALLVCDLVPRAGKVATPETWPEKVDSFYEAQFKRTLGSLVHRLREVTRVPPDLEKLLGQALEKRNWLSHHYFRERAMEFLSESGRDRMIAELEEARDLFDAADKALDAVVRPIRQRYGYSEEMLAKLEEEMLREARGEP
jgi:hypothetical protein